MSCFKTSFTGNNLEGSRFNSIGFSCSMFPWSRSTNYKLLCRLFVGRDTITTVAHKKFGFCF